MDAALEELRNEMEGEYGGDDGEDLQINLVDKDEEKSGNDSDGDIDEVEYGISNKKVVGDEGGGKSGDKGRVGDGDEGGDSDGDGSGDLSNSLSLDFGEWAAK